MKELSIEEKAKAYDNALNELQVIMELPTIKSNQFIGFDSIRHIFPELKEIEDDRIRKEMLEYCYKRMNNEFPSITIHQVERWLAWLEK